MNKVSLPLGTQEPLGLEERGGYFSWIPEPSRATPRCRNPDPVSRFKPTDRPAMDRSTWAP